MKKGITKEQVIEETLNLIKNNENIRSVNLRGVARALGCAHTNLYNYFTSFDELLWSAHIKILEIAVEKLNDKILETDDYELKLKYFYRYIVDFYLENRGWFRLSWFEILEGERPKEDEIANIRTVEFLIEIVKEIWINIYGSAPRKEKIKEVIHDTHCYLHGEISIYIAKRALIPEEENFKEYVVNKAIKITRLLLSEEE